MLISISDINLKKSYQARIEINDEKIEEYAVKMSHGEIFEPIVLYRIEGDLLLADGWHRYFAHVNSKKFRIEAEVKTGTLRDYKWACWEANKHGLPWTTEDKRKILSDALQDPEISMWTDSEIAKWLGVSHTFVGKYRTNKPDKVVFKRNGKEFMRKKGKVVEPEEVDIGVPERDQNAEVIEYLTKKNEELSDKLAVSMMGGSDSDKSAAEETIKALREEIELLQIDNRALKTSMDKYQRENAQLKRQVAIMQKRVL